MSKIETLYIILWLIFIPISPILPQIVGFISYLLLRRHNHLVAHILGVAIPPVASFYLFQRLFLVDPFLEDSNSLNKKLAIFLLVSLIHLFFSLLIHLALHNRHKLKEEKVS